MKTILDVQVGDRVMVFDPFLYKNDIDTPLSMTVKPATVICRYGYKSPYSKYIYSDLIDVKFDYIRHAHLDGDEKYISRGHFTDGCKLIEEVKQ